LPAEETDWEEALAGVAQEVPVVPVVLEVLEALDRE